MATPKRLVAFEASSENPYNYSVYAPFDMEDTIAGVQGVLVCHRAFLNGNEYFIRIDPRFDVLEVQNDIVETIEMVTQVGE